MSTKKSRRRFMLRGNELVVALAATVTSITVEPAGRREYSVSPQVACGMALSGFWLGISRRSDSRVFRLIEIDPRAPNISVPAFWSGRGVVRFHYPVTSKTVDLWDKIFARQRRAAATMAVTN